MNASPNILFLMTDQMQGRVLEPGHPCRTLNFDRLARRGVRFRRAYTPNAVCSPARASLMTGVLPHTHGVLEVTHAVDHDQCNLRTDLPHWAQYLEEAGYRTGYFGKWHVEKSTELGRFGWQCFELDPQLAARRKAAPRDDANPLLSYTLATPPGYRTQRFYGTTETPAEQRFMGLATEAAREFLEVSLAEQKPWCCFVSVTEPHDPFIAGRQAVEAYDIASLPLPESRHDTMQDKPGVYRKSARVFGSMSEREQREAAACYYASITEIDEQFGRLLDQIEAAGQIDNTIVVLTSDHGELLGAHGLYCKNFGAFDEVYNIPMLLCGPGIAQGETSAARVGLHDLGPTLLELTGCHAIESSDSRSFAPVLREPAQTEGFTNGYAEYFGTRFRLTQKVLWDGAWKLVFNGFDNDELYNLDDDPHELQNLIDEPAHARKLQQLFAQLWEKMSQTGDMAVLNTHYPPLRLAAYGPDFSLTE